MASRAKDKIIVALDVANAAAADRLAAELEGTAAWVKIGLQLFTAEGPSIVAALKERGCRIFLDLKIHDIPNTAREAVRSVVRLGVEMTTIHLSGGRDMVQAAVEAGEGSLTVLGVTVLTSLREADLRAIGVPKTPAEQVRDLVALGRGCGLRGVVCSPREIRLLREEFGESLTIVTPGVRPAGAEANDQHRTMTPSEAIAAGATYLVIGRPITAAPSPREAFLRLAEEIGQTGEAAS